MKTSLKFYAVCIMALLFQNLSIAQLEKGNYIDVALGLGVTSPYEGEDVAGTGFYFQTEYVFAIKKWFQVRPYAGLIFTSTSEDDKRESDNRVTANAFLLGGKVRFAAPIPYVAPYLEFGLGLSAGTFENVTSIRSIEHSGIFSHVPIAFGLALGKNNNVELEFTYYFQNASQLFYGAAAIGLTIPLNTKEN